MSLIDISQLGSIRIDDEAGPASGGWGAGRSGTLASRRRGACDAILAELGAADTPTDKPAVALRDYGDGCVAVGLAGAVDRARAHRIGVLLRELRPRSTRELVVTFERLGRWHPHLVRVIGQARIHHLIDGGRFELRGTTPDLADALGMSPGAAEALSRRQPGAEDRELRSAPWGLQG